MRNFIAYLLATFALVAYFPSSAQVWPDGPLGSVQSAIQQMGDSVHPNMLPFQPGRIHPYLMYGDSTMDHSESKIRMGLFAEMRGGYQAFDANQGIGSTMPGAALRINWKDKIIAEGQYAYLYERLPDYLNRYTDSLAVVPGIGFVRRDGSNWNGHYYRGKVSWNIDKIFSVEAGRDKHFWGDGYRSLIMSHNAAPYPYAKLNTNIWKVQYINLWTQMKDINIHNDLNQARKKFVAMHGLSWNATKKINLSLYEMVIYQATDTVNNRGVEINYVNPIIFFRPVEFQQGSADNVLLAFSASFKTTKKSKLYFQMLIDEFLLSEFRRREGWWGNKFGYQLGWKIFDAGVPGLNLQVEFNVVRPFTYTHGSVIQAYGHMNQGVAHPLGTNFVEGIFNLHYGQGKWTIDNNFVWAIYGRDRDGKNQGGNIFRSYASPAETHSNYWAQGLKSTLNWNEFRYTYLIHKKLNIRAQASLAVRYEKNEFEKRWDGMLQIGFVSEIGANYRDF